MIKIRKLKDDDNLHHPDFPRRWVMTRDDEDAGYGDILMGYFCSQQEAIEYWQFCPRIVVL